MSKPTLEALHQEMESARVAYADAHNHFQAALKESVGMYVIGTRDGLLYKVHSAKLIGTPTLSRPWVTGHLLTKKSAWSQNVRNLYSDWRKPEADEIPLEIGDISE